MVLTFGDASATPPDGNDVLIHAGDGGATLVAAAGGHQGLADMVMAEMTAILANAGTTGATGWQGVGGTAMMLSAQEYSTVLELMTLWLMEAFEAATEAALAHQTAATSMIPAVVCTTNLATQQGLALTNFCGLNSPAIAALHALYQEYWTQNATLMNTYQTIVAQVLTVLSTPPPMSPTAADPAAAAAAAASNSAQSTAQGALQASAKTMNQTAESAGSSANPMGAGSQMSSMLGQVSSLGGQLSGLAGQLPQLLTSAPQQLSGMFGPLSSMFGGMGGAQNANALGGIGGGGPSAGGSAASGLTAGGGGLGGGVFTASPASASMVRPASSFSSGSAPRLPGGWQPGSTPPAEPVAAPSATGGGGLYGAPAAARAGRDEGSGSEKTADRTMQVTGRPMSDRGERQRT